MESGRSARLRSGGAEGMRERRGLIRLRGLRSCGPTSVVFPVLFSPLTTIFTVQQHQRLTICFSLFIFVYMLFSTQSDSEACASLQPVPASVIGISLW